MTGCTAAQCLAEVYAVITGMAGKDRASPGEALLFLADVRERLTVVTLTEADYGSVLTDAAGLGIFGGGIYDALIGRCAAVAKADAIYTWNVRHFARLGPAVASHVRRP